MIDTSNHLKTIVVEAEFSPHTPQAPLPWHHQWWYWTIKIKDYIFYSEAPDNKKEQYIALRSMQLYYNPPPDWWEPKDTLPSISQTYLGMALDIDSPSDSGAMNSAGSYDENRRMTYIQGFGEINEKYRMAIAQRDPCYDVEIGPGLTISCCWPDPGILAQKEEPYCMWVLRNDLTVYPFPGGYDDANLYMWMSTPGNGVQGDGSPTDYNIVSTGKVIPAQGFPPADTYSVAYALIVSDEENMDKLNDCVDMIICGNVNRDGSVNIADVVYMTNYLFKDGPEIWRYMGDVNADGIASIADVVYLIAYLFRGASPPKCSAL